MIHSHLYARIAEARVYDAPSVSGHPICTLPRGNWLGVLGQRGEWVQVLTLEGIGWVMAEDLEARPPFALHVCRNEGGLIEYINVDHSGS
jgi:hypothetical protein